MSAENPTAAAAVKSLLVSATYFPPQTGGISRWMRAVAEGLGPEEVCCLTGVPADQPRTESSRVRVHRLRNVFAGPRWREALGRAQVALTILPRERPRVVQLGTVYDCSLGLWLHRWFGLPLVVYAHGNELLLARHDTWPKPRQCLVRAARVIAASSFTAGLAFEAGARAERVLVVHPGCDTEYFRPLEVGDAERRRWLGEKWQGRIILTTGNLVARKGHDTVIRAFSRVKAAIPDAVYVVAGDGPHRGELERLVADRGLRESVIFTGRVSDADLPKLYSLAEVFVMPSRERREKSDVEGFGIVFVEAGACGLPVVAGRSGGIRDAVVEGETGLLVEPESEEQVAAALLRFLSDRDLAERMGRQGRERAERLFRWPVVIQRIREILAAAATEKT
jgi:phosphatidylinositol alpha-1,6-mannosyltransferase